MSGNKINSNNRRKKNSRKPKRLPILSIILIALFIIVPAAFFYVGMRDSPGRAAPAAESPPPDDDVIENTPQIDTTPVEPTNPPMPPAVKVHGIYYLAEFHDNDTLGRCIELVNTTSINAVVVDVKDDYGNLTFTTNNETLSRASESFIDYMRSMRISREDVMNLKSNNAYMIARVVCFKDNPYAVLNPSNAIQSNLGGPWLDKDNLRWLDPYNKDNWDYILEFCKEAADIGFDEIQLDYVRFPLEGRLSDIDYGPGSDEQNKYQIINDFVSFIRDEMAKLGVRTSADIFGVVGMSYQDARDVGQNVQLLLGSLDSICPMIYPSHFNHREGQFINGILFERPNLQPYEVIYNTLQHYVRQVDEFREENPGMRPAIIRPYLQNFTAAETYIGTDNYLEYGPDEVGAQIQAVYDSGFDEWILWTTNNSLDPGMIP